MTLKVARGSPDDVLPFGLSPFVLREEEELIDTKYKL
jgi:hypothetical protein